MFFNKELIFQKKLKLFTLLFVQKPKTKQILLGLKKRGFGANRLNGFGGKIEDKETIRGATLREFIEESGLCPSNKDNDLIKRAVLYFEFLDQSETIFEVHVYSIFDFDDKIEVTEVLNGDNNLETEFEETDSSIVKNIEWIGKLEETEEMKPEWFSYDKVPFDSMWPDDKHWFPYLLGYPKEKQNKYFRGHFIFTDFDTIKSFKLEKISEENKHLLHSLVLPEEEI
ncbi:hypothetical protein ABK040_011155 [Willaertia magna]